MVNKYKVVGYTKVLEKYGEKVIEDIAEIFVHAESEREAMAKAKKVLKKKYYKVMAAFEEDPMRLWTIYREVERKICGKRHDEFIKSIREQTVQLKNIANALGGKHKYYKGCLNEKSTV